jgi:hypothetical protein
MACLLDKVHQIEDVDILFPHISFLYRHPPCQDILHIKIFSIHIYRTSAYILPANICTIYKNYLSIDTLPLQISLLQIYAPYSYILPSYISSLHSSYISLLHKYPLSTYIVPTYIYCTVPYLQYLTVLYSTIL